MFKDRVGTVLLMVKSLLDDYQGHPGCMGVRRKAGEGHSPGHICPESGLVRP